MCIGPPVGTFPPCRMCIGPPIGTFPPCRMCIDLLTGTFPPCRMCIGPPIGTFPPCRMCISPNEGFLSWLMDCYSLSDPSLLEVRYVSHQTSETESRHQEWYFGPWIISHKMTQCFQCTLNQRCLHGSFDPAVQHTAGTVLDWISYPVWPQRVLIYCYAMRSNTSNSIGW